MRCSFTTDCCYPWAVNGLMREVIKGHLTEHIVHQGDELKREEDLDVVLKVLDSYIK